LGEFLSFRLLTGDYLEKANSKKFTEADYQKLKRI